MLGFNMRKLLPLMVLLAALGGGLYLVLAELFWADPIYRIYFGVSGAMLASWAAYSLWIEFFAPLLGLTIAEE
jgi:hypothetical protein